MSATQAHTGSGGAESLRKDLAAIAQFLACEEHHSRVTWKESVLTISDANLAKEKDRLKHCLAKLGIGNGASPLVGALRWAASNSPLVAPRSSWLYQRRLARWPRRSTTKRHASNCTWWRDSGAHGPA